MLATRIVFLKKFFDEPAKIGSIIPSSKFLTRKMLADLPWSEMGNIVELGAGTGVFTEYIAQYKKETCKAVIIEQDPVMLAELRVRFPDMLFGRRAENLSYIFNELNLAKADCIISGLPFAMFTPDLRESILDAATTQLKKDGRFIAFQYSLQMYPMFHRRFSEVKVGIELRNFPPAFVYYCRQ